MSISDIPDRQIGVAFRSYVRWWTRGTLDDLVCLYDEMAEADRSGFPWQAAAVALANVETRRLYRAFDDDELQDLYDLCEHAGMYEQAAKFAQAVLARPYVDDGRVPEEVRNLVRQRDSGRCQSCGATEDLTIDHKLIPWIDGGSSSDPDNLQLLCRSCNSRKGTRPWPLSSQEEANG